MKSRTLRYVAAFAAFVSATVSPAVITSASAQSIPLLRDSEIELYLSDYSRPIFEAAGLPAQAVNIYIVGDNTPNAFVSGGLNMFIFTGLITLADRPNQIEGVIAHETGHMAGGHLQRGSEAYKSAAVPMLLGLVLAAGAIAAGAPDAGMAVLGLGATIGQANALKYSRGQEASADQAAVTFLDGVGHSSDGLTEFFGKLRNSQIITGRRVNPYLQSHPLANARMTALAERTAASPFQGQRDTEAEIFRLKMIQAKIFGFLQEGHYTLRQYPLSDQSMPAHYARAVAYYRTSDIDKALSEMATLIEFNPSNPYFYELKGQMLFEHGRVADAVAPHRKSVELAPTDALLKINLGRALVAVGGRAELQQAVTELKGALLLERDNSFGWFELARAYGGLDNEPMAMLATAESRYHAGSKVEAGQFAARALARFERNTPEWRQASDIVLAATDGKGLSKSKPEQQEPEPKQDDPARPGDVPDPAGD